ncbi:MAG: hypothetical protein LUQ25_00965, partial [Methanoregulaceae archaeon]|nr:hypothetical protein [Methanoregulaceae archaeon]
HPNALRFLVRDISNINSFFSKWCDVRDEREIFSEVTGMHQKEDRNAPQNKNPGVKENVTGH